MDLVVSDVLQGIENAVLQFFHRHPIYFVLYKQLVETSIYIHQKKEAMDELCGEPCIKSK